MMLVVDQASQGEVMHIALITLVVLAAIRIMLA